MKRPGEDGYDFPCGDSHTRIDWADSSPGQVPKFYNNYVGRIYHPTVSSVSEFLKRASNNVQACNLFLEKYGNLPKDKV